jgi:hypothetical protein
LTAALSRRFLFVTGIVTATDEVRTSDFVIGFAASEGFFDVAADGALVGCVGDTTADCFGSEALCVASIVASMLFCVVFDCVTAGDVPCDRETSGVTLGVCSVVMRGEIPATVALLKVDATTGVSEVSNVAPSGVPLRGAVPSRSSAGSSLTSPTSTASSSSLQDSSKGASTGAKNSVGARVGGGGALVALCAKALGNAIESLLGFVFPLIASSIRAFVC